MNAISEGMAANRNVESANVLERLAAGEKSAVEECVNLYGDAVWRLVNKFIHSPKDTEMIILDVFADFWKCSKDSEAGDFKEADLIALILRRRLNIYRRQGSMRDLQDR